MNHASNDLIILFGGPSNERLVSVASAQHITQILPEAKCWFWAVNGRIHSVSHEKLQAHERPFEREFSPGPGESWHDCERAFDSCSPQTVMVLALHGAGGEDGQVQRWLEERRICFTGSSAEVSHLAFDKAAAKEVLRRNGVRVPDSAVVSGRNPAEAQEALERLFHSTKRTVMKPVSDGSSHGIYFIDNEVSLQAALQQLKAQPEILYLCETFIAGTELTVGVYDTENGARPLPVSEVRLDQGRNFDYAGKYLGKGTIELTPAEVSEEVREAAQKVALLAHQSIGCRGYSRTDMIVDRDGPVFLEINNLPGMTRASFIPQQLACAGISMKDFLEGQIALARTRYEIGNPA